MTRSELRAGIAESLPLGLALIPVGIAFGYLAHTAGLSWWLAGLMSAIVYAGPSQFIAMGLVGTGAAVAAIVATTFVTNLRYSLFEDKQNSTPPPDGGVSSPDAGNVGAKMDAGMPESFNVLVKEIRSLGINIELETE